jgi:peptidoglycan hydrolase-like protein with peptidoglycan-binding domain
MNKFYISSAILFFTSIFSLSPSVTYAAFDHDLHFGLIHSKDVAVLQTFLFQRGMYDGPINGNYFSLTKKAVIAFQIDEGISPSSGYFGEESRKHIKILTEDKNFILEASSDIATSSITTANLGKVSIQDLASTTNSLLQQVSDLSTKYTSLEDKISELSSSTLMLSDQFQSLQSTLSTLQDSITNLITQVASTPSSPSTVQSPTPVTNSSIITSKSNIIIPIIATTTKTNAVTPHISTITKILNLNTVTATTPNATSNLNMNGK